MSYKITRIPRYEIELDDEPVLLTFHQISHIFTSYVATRRAESLMRDIKSDWLTTDYADDESIH